MIILSKRLKAIADMVTPCASAIDVGCDHGFLSIYLVENDIAGRVYATDINSGPLERAQEHINEHNLGKCIETIQCDGLMGLKNNNKTVDAIVIAGMGGRMISKILSDSPDIASSATQLVFGPQSELEQFRYSLMELGYRIVSETMIEEEGKFYPIIKATSGKMELDRVQAMYGPCLLEDKNPVLKDFLTREREYKLDILWNLTGNKSAELSEEISERAGNRVREIKEELALNDKALGIVG